MPLNNFRSVHLPYCLQRQPDGRYVVLNREYKPLGFETRDHIDYGQYPIAVTFKGLTPSVAAKVSHSGSDDLAAIFLYSDASIPTRSATNMKAYLDKLAVLARLTIVAKD